MNENIKKYFTMFIVLLPIISVYDSGIPGLNIGDLILFVIFTIWLYKLYKNNWNLKLEKNCLSLLPLIVAIPVLTLLSYILQNLFMSTFTYNFEFWDSMSRIVRRDFYYIFVLLVCSDMFDYDKGCNYFVNVAKFGAIFMIIQYICFYCFHKYIPGFIPFLPVFHKNYQQIDYDKLFNSGAGRFRPTSFLLEPAHLSRYIIIPLIILLFDEKKYKHSILWSLFLTLTIILSTSGTGLICCSIVWAIWILKVIIKWAKEKHIEKNNLILLICIFIGILFVIQTPIFKSALSRILNTRLDNVNTAGGARFRGFIQYFKLPLIYKVVGMGYGSTPATTLSTWFSGASYILYGCGILGFISCLYFFARTYFKKECTLFSKVLLIIFFLLFFMDDNFMSHVSILYFCFILFSYNKSLKVNK